jgi:hypothetical protein
MASSTWLTFREGTRDTSLVPRAKNRAQQQLVPCLRCIAVHLSLQTYCPHRFSGARTQSLSGWAREAFGSPLSTVPFLSPMRCMKLRIKYQGISVNDMEDEQEEARCAIRDRCLVLATVIRRWAYCSSVVGDSARGPYLTVLLLSESGMRSSAVGDEDEVAEGEWRA